MTVNPSDPRWAQLDKVIPPAMERASVPGAIVGVWQDGQALYVRTFGVSDTATGKPMTTDMHIRIGSNSKAFTITALLMLADQGKLSVDDPISDTVEGVPGGDKITLRQLAGMRSGIYSYSDETNRTIVDEPNRQWTPDELIAVAVKHPPLFPSGAKFDYSNTNTVMLGKAIEKASGQTLKSFIEQHIIKPLGLEHTLFPTGAEIPEPFSHGYFAMPDGKLVDATHWNPSWGWASGNMISTLEDLAVWARALANGELLSPAMKKEREKFLPAPGEGDGALYGLALENQNGWLGHNGNVLSSMVYPYYLPAEDITVVVLLNSGANALGTWSLMEDVIRIVTPDHRWPGAPKE